MTRRRDIDDDELDDELDLDPEGPDESDLIDDDPTYVACPHCGKPVPEDAEQCMHCRMYLSLEDEDAPVHPASSPVWILVTAVMVIAGIVLGYLIVRL